MRPHLGYRKHLIIFTLLTDTFSRRLVTEVEQGPAQPGCLSRAERAPCVVKGPSVPHADAGGSCLTGRPLDT